MRIEEFEKPYWASNGHTQTLIAHLKKDKVTFNDEEKKYIPTIDGDQLLLKIHPRNTNKWLILAHGLAGSSESNYILRLTKLALAENISVIRFNHRNCGESMGTSKKPYHSGRGEDLFAAVKYVNDKYPAADVIVVGYSLSGNVVLNMLARFEDQMKIKLAISVNGAIDLAASAKRFLSLENKIYDKYFVQLLRGFNYQMYKKGFFQGSFSEVFAKLPLNANLIDYDNLFTAPLSGYADAWDYYEQCSAKSMIAKIKTKTVILTAKDDPIIPVETFLNLKPPSNVEVVIQNFGGHLGYLTRNKTPNNDNRWMDWFLLEKIKLNFSSDHL